jgi:type VI secretion system secreted protein Hcp
VNGRIRFGALLLACALLLAIPATSPAKIFLELDGIQGEATEQGFENQIEAHSFQWGTGRSSSSKAAAFSEISMTKDVDKSSPTLMLRTASGATIPSAKVRITKSTDAGEVTFLRYCFTGVRITGVSQSSGGGLPNESLSFSYATFQESYTQQDSGGGQSTVFSGGWDLVKNLQLGGACTN